MKFSRICTHSAPWFDLCDFFKLKFVVNSQHLFFEEIMLNFLTYKMYYNKFSISASLVCESSFQLYSEIFMSDIWFFISLSFAM
jgi:hypothetical protein